MSRACSSTGVALIIFVSAVALGAGGCAGSGKVVELAIHADSLQDMSMQSAGQAQPLTVVVKPFNDLRETRDRLGVRTHLGGGLTVFTVQDGEAATVVAQVIADYLGQRGWKTSVGESGANPDVIVSGNLTEFSVRAKSRFFSTLMTASLRLVLRAENTADGSITTMSLEDAREDTAFWFDPEDLEALANAMLQESVRNMLASVRVRDGILRMK